AAVDAHTVRRAVAAAERALRADAAVVHDEGGARLAASQAHRIVDAEAAAPLAGPARAFAQGVLLEQDRVELLDHFDGRRLGDADRRAAVAEAVVVGIAAIAAPGDLVHDVGAAACRVPAAEREISTGAGRRRRHALRDRLDQGGEDRLGDALGHLCRAA